MAARQLNDWVESYMDYTADQESPDSIHFWTALAVISGAIGRKVWMNRNVYTLFPNIYVCIVADSAKVRKSVATSIGFNLLKEAVPTLSYIEDRMTPEGLVKLMNRTVITSNGTQTLIGNDSTVFIYEDEIASLFSYDRSTAARMSTLLTSIYSCKDDYMHTTSTGGQVRIHKPCVTLIAATAPEGLATIPQDASGGLLGRVIMVTSGARRKSIAWPRQLDQTLHDALVADLVVIGQLAGQVVVTPDAMQLFEVWYNKQSQLVFQERWLEAFHERCHDTALKLSMILAFSRSDDLIIGAAHIEGAIRFIEQIMPNLKHVGVWLTPDPMGQARARVEAFLMTHGVSKRSTVMQATRVTAKEMDDIEVTLEQNQWITIQVHGKDRIYTWTKT